MMYDPAGVEDAFSVHAGLSGIFDTFASSTIRADVACGSE